MADDQHKIFVDSDWKMEAQREKEHLAEKFEQREPQHLPEPSFQEIVSMIAMQAMISLGGMKLPDGRQLEPDMNMARHHIDLLEILHNKTVGNLDDTERGTMDATLHDLRMAYVHTINQAQQSTPPETAP